MIEQSNNKEETLKSAISELVALSHELYGVIFGTLPLVERKEPITQNNLLGLRNDVLEANVKLREVSESLKVIL